jgi:hypothetical protein
MNVKLTLVPHALIVPSLLHSGLDYTNNFAGNERPDEFLYNFLADLYGTVDGLPRNKTSSNGESSGQRRLRRSRINRGLFSSVYDPHRRQELLSRWDEINFLVVNGFVASESEGWRRLHHNEYGSAHEIQLDDTYKVQVHMLLA